MSEEAGLGRVGAGGLGRGPTVLPSWQQTAGRAPVASGGAWAWAGPMDTWNTGEQAGTQCGYTSATRGNKLLVPGYKMRVHVYPHYETLYNVGNTREPAGAKCK